MIELKKKNFLKMVEYVDDNSYRKMSVMEFPILGKCDNLRQDSFNQSFH